MTLVLTDWVAVVSALIAAGGLVFAALELRHVRQRRVDEERLETEGVVVTWQPLETPRRAEDDGTAIWLYEIVVHNPGRFPISGVKVYLTFPVTVRRVHYDGTRDAPTTTLVLEQSVVRGDAERQWERTVLMNYAEGMAHLPSTTGTVEFTDVRGRARLTTWPRRPEATGNAKPSPQWRRGRPTT